MSNFPFFAETFSFLIIWGKHSPRKGVVRKTVARDLQHQVQIISPTSNNFAKAVQLIERDTLLIHRARAEKRIFKKFPLQRTKLIRCKPPWRQLRGK